MGKLFAKYYDRAMEPIESKKLHAIRSELLYYAKGNVLEIGSGTGVNFQYYKNVTVTALEPNELMLKQSLPRSTRSSVPIKIINGSAESLPFEDNTFDTIVGTLVFCSIPDAERAMKEMRRVCKPTGILLLFEHIRIDHKFFGRLQDLMTPLWKKLCDGCHLNRNTLRLIEDAGFEIVKVERYFKDIFITVHALNVKEEQDESGHNLSRNN